LKKNINYISSVIKSLPSGPGVYQYFDKDGKIIYVGKAKNLKKRVSSYFNKEQISGKLKLLVRRIADIKFIVTETETDALLLENNLIKKYQPRYNVLLKDDKSFPWICIKNEPFPRVFSTRHPVKDGSEYYGPYASVKMVNILLDTIRQLYPLRTCKLNLSKKNITSGKFKVCLEYHIGNCNAPCVGLQSEDDYNKNIQQVRSIIKGNLNDVTIALKRMMLEYSAKTEFEKAQNIKEKIELLDKYKSKSTIVNPKINNVDVFSILSDEDVSYVNFLKVVKGAVLQAHTVEIKKRLEETDMEILLFAIIDFRKRFDSHSDEIILPFVMDLPLESIKITVPKRGDKKDLLDLSIRNAKYFRNERLKQQLLVDPERHTRRIMEKMKSDLRLDNVPAVIECFDNSNFQGTYPVAAMVQFVNGKPNKKAYRHYDIKTVEGPDDFASMEEVIFRRYSRLLKENKPIPDLIIVDGGKGQLNAALKSLHRLKLAGKVPILGIAKKLEALYYPGDSVPLYLDKKSETLKVIQYLRDEAHRFGITHHRGKRQKETLKSELTSVKGIGDGTAKKLLSFFKSVKKIKEADMIALEEQIGKSKAQIVYQYYHPKKTS